MREMFMQNSPGYVVVLHIMMIFDVHAISDVTYDKRVSATQHRAARETNFHSRYAGTRQRSTVQRARRSFRSELIVAMAAKILVIV